MPRPRLGPQAERIYSTLRERIGRGRLTPGTRLSSHRSLAREFGVAPMTLRGALDRLQDEGLIACEHGRGTFVREPGAPVAVAHAEPAVRAQLADEAARAGHRALGLSDGGEVLAALAGTDRPSVVLVGSRLPDAAGAVELIRSVRRGWPDVAVIALTTDPADLAPLHGTPEWPLLVVPHPATAEQIAGALTIACPPPSGRSADDPPRYRQMVESSPAGIWAIDAASRTTYANPRLAELLGYDAAEMVGRPVSAFLDPESHRPALESAVRHVVGQPGQGEYVYRRKDGTRLRALVTAQPLRDDAGAFAGSLAVVVPLS